MSSRKLVKLLPCFGMALFAVLVCESAHAQSAAASQAMAAQQQGDFAEAEKDWRAAVAQNPQDAVAYANLGFVLAHQNKYTEAVPAYRKATQIKPSIPGVQLNWGIAEFKQGHFEEAIGPLTAAVAADPESGQA